MSRGGRSGGSSAKRGPDLSWEDEEVGANNLGVSKRGLSGTSTGTGLVPNLKDLNANVPGPLYPDRRLRTPRPLSIHEKRSVHCFLRFRDHVHRGEMFTELDKAQKKMLMDERGHERGHGHHTLIQINAPTPGQNGPRGGAGTTVTKVKRVGFDPFNDQARYSKRPRTTSANINGTSNEVAAKANGTANEKEKEKEKGRGTTTDGLERKRKTPDLSHETGRGLYGYTLRFFPQELWGYMDPQRTLPDWQEVGEDSVAWASLPSSRTAAVNTKKKQSVAAKKKRKALTFDEGEGEGEEAEKENDADDDGDDNDEDEDGLSRRRKRNKSKKEGVSKRNTRSEKKGLDAEDDYGDSGDENSNNKDDADGDGAGGDADGEGDGAADDEEPQDSEFEESDDAGGDDYDAEQYFNNGEDEDFADGGGGGDDDGADF